MTGIDSEPADQRAAGAGPARAAPTTNADQTSAALSDEGDGGHEAHRRDEHEQRQRAAWPADSAIASVRVGPSEDAGRQPAERPTASARLSQTRHAWSAGYWPIRNSRRLSVTTPQRASVSAHSADLIASQHAARRRRRTVTQRAEPGWRTGSGAATPADRPTVQRRRQRLVGRRVGHRSSTWTRRL